MIPYDIDPSLHSAEPEPPQLDDGFSPPAHHDDTQGQPQPLPQGQAEAALGEISPF
jgi:hypothetical protein